MSSTKRFGYEWERYSILEPLYEKQFRNWVYPLTTHDFKGKIVLDAGCGMGRNSYWAVKWGASNLIAFDFDQRTVKAAKKNLAMFKNAEVWYKDIYGIDWADSFDIAFSIGVIHHLREPKKAMVNMVRSLKPGGRLVIWVYGYEGNEWIVKYVNPIRKHVTSKLPLRFVHGFSYLFSVPLWLFVKTFKGPSDYLKQLSEFRLWHIHSIVFDQLIPEISHYWKKDDIKGLCRDIGLSSYKIIQPPNKNGWVLQGFK